MCKTPAARPIDSCPPTKKPRTQRGAGVAVASRKVERGQEFYQIKPRGEQGALVQVTCRQLPAPAIHVAIEILKKLACKGYNKQQLQESKKELIRLRFDAAPGSSAEDLFASVETR